MPRQETRVCSVLICETMKFLQTLIIVTLLSLAALGQSPAQKVYDTERAFEKMVAEKGIRDGFIEFLSPLGVIFRPGPVNARESWRSRPASPAALTWNPIKIEVSSNGALAYSIGNSIYRPKGKNDTDEFYGHYLSIWTRQPNGDYRAALDTGVNHEKPAIAACRRRCNCRGPRLSGRRLGRRCGSPFKLLLLGLFDLRSRCRLFVRFGRRSFRSTVCGNFF